MANEDDEGDIVVYLGTGHHTVGTHDPVGELLPYPDREMWSGEC